MIMRIYHIYENVYTETHHLAVVTNQRNLNYTETESTDNGKYGNSVLFFPLISQFSDYPGFKSYEILLNKFENPSTHSSQDLMEILDTILQSKLKFSFILLMILVFYNTILISFLQFSYKKKKTIYF